MQNPTNDEFYVCNFPEEEPLVEKHLLHCLGDEVTKYYTTVKGTKCLLCPFRSFDRLSRLKAHIKHHIEQNMFLADGRSKQRAVVRAYYNYQCSIAPICSFDASNLGLLRKSADLIKRWNSKCSKETLALLSRQNRPVLVRVLTHTGPEYWTKELTSRCIRLSRELYYTSRFADLYLSMLLTNEGRILTSLDALHLHFGTTSKVSGLLPSYSQVWKSLAQILTTDTIFIKKVKELRYKAADRGEYLVVTHDETYKTLFALIGQKKMAQAGGELHALHTFRGFSGCTLGISPQRSTSQVCFKSAVYNSFDFYLSSKVRFLFSDSPLRVIGGARACFSSLLAVGEDPIHLAIRVEYCLGGKVSGPSLRIRQLHNKFCVATLEHENF